MGVEQGGPSGKDIEPYNDEGSEINPVQKKLHPIQRIKRSLGLERRSENVSSSEIEDPEFMQWLEAISWKRGNAQFFANKILDSELSRRTHENEERNLQEAQQYYDRAKVTVDKEKKERLESLASAFEVHGWKEGIETYVDSMGLTLLNKVVEQMHERGNLSLEEREGLMYILTTGLSKSLRNAVVNGDVAERYQLYHDAIEEDMKGIYHDIKDGVIEPYVLGKDNKIDLFSANYGLEVYGGVRSYRNHAPFYAILTYERGSGQKELLMFAMERLERMGKLQMGGMVVERETDLQGIHGEEVIAGDCVIIAARLAKLLGLKQKQQELYNQAYNFFGKLGEFISTTEKFTGITFHLAQRSYPKLLARVSECARGADLPEAKTWEDAYARSIGEKPKENIEPEGDRNEPKELPDKFD